jgi:predicted O-methyltransferase YrrM
MKGSIARVPVAGPLLRAAWRSARTRIGRPAALHTLARATHPSASRIATALSALHTGANDVGAETLLAIEKERTALWARHDLLADGNEGAPGLYDDGVTVAEACAASKPPDAARFLYWLVREFAPNRAIELGTNLGISSAYQAAALSQNADGGRIVTLESSPYRQRLARELHARVGLRNVDYRLGLFADTLDAAVSELGPIDFAFIDGHHQCEPTLDYFERVWRFARDEAVLVFDDIHWSEGMERAWQSICDDARVALAVDLYAVGVCVVRREPVHGERCVPPPMRYAL